ncbi:5-dehydro-2-deoxygluconokinase [Ciceribacter sp. L1K22]|uniref:bifunctional 5-dehydro-2-deoxygluconokinase/5-dehydro-2- deoxyphosphogluconate aldolase n=1 Tax=Ciceribacter sp. L1K22 TaxID=2820275 RepID=UPI001ABEA779|nr:5-dehydro-2-deoxygluconokinase [Ciceribacter sp. L1K22]MBO3761637.1 5-dehydro-2-deoxygluconokinase [Ciceribacter sp. L1K22]
MSASAGNVTQQFSKKPADDRALDVITIGRSSVDLYGQQIGSRLEDISSFAKSVGGCPTNIAVGTARLGLRSGLISRVGAEQMGRFICEQLEREGVDTSGVRTDPDRLTALVLLSVENDRSFPLIFYRENCADMALDVEDIDPGQIASSASVLVTGTHFSRENTYAAQMRAIEIARSHNRKVVFDIDYRPNLWGLAGHAAGDQRYIASGEVSAKLREILPLCDLIVGTEEEILIASGENDCLAAVRAIRALSNAVIVLKRGPMGCIVYEAGDIDALEDGIVGQGFPIEVYNVLGAGDAFMSGFLRGWLRGERLETCATWANACGAFAVSRLLCAPEIPTWPELQHFLEHGSPHRALRKDVELNHIHTATTRRNDLPQVMAFAIDHRSQLVEMAEKAGAPLERIEALKILAVEATAKVAQGRRGFGMLLDERFGRQALARASEVGLDWIGRPVEEPGSRPLRFEYGQDIGAQLVAWPVTHCIKALTFYHPGDPEALKSEQISTLQQLCAAARSVGRELLIEIIASKCGKVDADTVATVIRDIYSAGIRPDWWKLEPQADAFAWRNIEAAIAEHDPWCRGVLLLGLDAPMEEIREAFAVAAPSSVVKGFAVGRTLFGAAAADWLTGRIDDETAVGQMADRFQVLVDDWLSLR